MRPYLKWVGGKYRLAPTLEAHLPDGRLIEPFVGAGGFFLGSRYQTAILGDTNEDLILAHKCMASPERYPLVVKEVERLFQEDNQNAVAYMDTVDLFNNKSAPITPHLRAAQMIYLNKHCFNGIWRTSKSGRFNSPYGKRKPYPPLDEMHAFHERCQAGVQFVHGDFRKTIGLAGAGDVVYADPPYFKWTAASFVSYAAGGFTVRDQEDLVLEGKRAAERGATFAISNAATPECLTMYQDHGAEIAVRFKVQRRLAAAADARVEQEELLAVWRAK